MPIPAHKDYRLFCPWEGVVTRRDDPEGLHRVKVFVPGLIQETGWIFPLDAGGGPSRGGHSVPDVNALVVVWFLGGDVERARYMPGHWGIRKDTGKETPATMVAAGAQAHLVSEWQIGPLLFTVDERARAEDGSGQRFSVIDTNADKVVLEYDFELQAWSLKADYLIDIVSGGILRLNGLQIQVADRIVRRSATRPL